ncbi:alpha/beta hydrolase [Montanilutibacter psychrotolerans]|uniref:Alpha/beta hydrolase n=1 Tax=Montanilutibacter psychrotolerans TaxID=1327343 RepID=A0A3M8SQW4_9GAMM|nr:alpha/beta fold hydrolase [Lysobacter psychrotolerans]RNF83669.1 alpha/beta hydrolase [Lysobacter psychrotolerans]
MRTARYLIAALTAALLLPGCSAPNGSHDATAASGTDAGTWQFGKIAFKPCSLSSPVSPQSIDGRCATLAVPEDPAKPGGRKITLNLAWLPSNARGEPAADPVFFLAGGPGQAATEHAATVSNGLREVRKRRDIVLVDQRGTGTLSTLACKGNDGKPIAFDETRIADTATVADLAQRCAAALQGKADPRLYTTTEAITDLEAVRAALGVEQVNLVGVSYGTRVAQQYATRYPSHTRTMLLDGIAPNDLVVGNEFARTFERALRLQSANCHKVPACKARFPRDLRSQLTAVRQRLSAQPVEVDYRDPSTGVTKRDTLTGEGVLGLSHAFSYMPQMAALLPVVIDDAEQGRYAPLMALSQLVTGSMEGQMTRGMQWSVLCAEDADRARPDPADADTVIGADMSTMFFAACKAWPTGKRPSGFNTPIRSPVPALLMSGEIDPVTPPEYGDRVLKGLPNGRHFVLAGQGHNVLGTGCMPKLIGQFIETANAKALDGKCLDTIGYVPPFTSFNGWEP